MASGNSAAVNTAGLQAFINYIAQNPPAPSFTGVLDCGTYHINAQINIPVSQGWILDGQNVASHDITGGCTNIVQDTDGTKIFVFSHSFTEGWTIRNLSLSWLNNNQSNTGAIGIFFTTDGANYAQWNVYNVTFGRGCCFLKEDGTVSPVIYSAVIDRNHFGGRGDACGAFISFKQATTLGQGDISVTNNYTSQCDAGGIDSTVYMNACSPCHFANNDWGNTSFLPALDFESATVSMDNIKIGEPGNFVPFPAGGAFVVINGGSLNINGDVFLGRNTINNAGQKFFAFQGNGTVNISGCLDASSVTVTAGSFFADDVNNMTVQCIVGFSGTPSYAWTDVVSTNSVVGLVMPGLDSFTISADRGDASYTWTPDGKSAAIQKFATPLTASRGLIPTNTYNITGNTCARALVAPGVTANFSLGLYDPSATLIYTVPIGGQGIYGICYQRATGTNIGTWYPMQK